MNTADLMGEIRATRLEVLGEVHGLRDDITTLKLQVERLRTFAAIAGGVSGLLLTLLASWLK